MNTKTQQCSTESVIAVNNDLRAMMREMIAQQALTNKNLEDVQLRMVNLEQRAYERMDMVQADVVDLKEAVTNNVARISAIESKAETIEQIENKISKLEQQIVDCQQNNESLKQNNLRQNIRIMGIPTMENEDLSKVFLKICAVLGVKMNKSEFNARRVAEGIIAVKVNELQLKSRIIRSIRKRKTLLSEEIGFIGQNTQIFINDHLTPYYSAILKEARKAKFNKQLAAAWTFQNKIFVKSNEEDKPIEIANMEALQQHLKQSTSSSGSSGDIAHDAAADSISAQPMDTQVDLTSPVTSHQEHTSMKRKAVKEKEIKTKSKKQKPSNVSNPSCPI